MISSEASACGLPHRELLRVWRGTKLGPSGEIQYVPSPPNFGGGGLSHAGPWDYLQRVPLFFYGPGYIPETGRVSGPANLTDIAPTMAELLDFPFRAPDGHALGDAIEPASQRPAPPRLVVTVVWDGSGRDVLDTWPDDWPHLASMIPHGVWFEDAQVGSSPSNTPPTHASIGTGAFPRRTGVVDLYQDVDGVIEKPSDHGPGPLLLPTLADLYDVAMDNEPVVGLVATLGAHTSMLGHGSAWEGGDADIAVLREADSAITGGDEGDVWQLNANMAPWFTMPGYIDDVPGIETDTETLDQADGALDGNWGTYPLDALDDGFQSPARAPYETRIIEEVIRREGFGADDVPDLLYVNYKAIDSVGHLFSANGKQMGQTVRAHDESLGTLVRFLNEQVGRGRWVMALTADHGSQLDPEMTGALSIGVDPLTRYLAEQLPVPEGDRLVRRIRPTQIWLKNETMASNGYTAEDVAAALRDATLADVAGDAPYGGDPSDPAFSAAFPSAVLGDLPCLPAEPG